MHAPDEGLERRSGESFHRCPRDIDGASMGASGDNDEPFCCFYDEREFIVEAVHDFFALTEALESR